MPKQTSSQDAQSDDLVITFEGDFRLFQRFLKEYGRHISDIKHRFATSLISQYCFNLPSGTGDLIFTRLNNHILVRHVDYNTQGTNNGRRGFLNDRFDYLLSQFKKSGIFKRFPIFFY